MLLALLALPAPLEYKDPPEPRELVLRELLVSRGPLVLLVQQASRVPLGLKEPQELLV